MAARTAGAGGARAGGSTVVRRATKIGGAGGAGTGVRNAASVACARHSGHSAQSGPRWSSRRVGDSLPDGPAWQIGITLPNAKDDWRAASQHGAMPMAIWPSSTSTAARKPGKPRRRRRGRLGIIRRGTVARSPAETTRSGDGFGDRHERVIRYVVSLSRGAAVKTETFERARNHADVVSRPRGAPASCSAA